MSLVLLFLNGRIRDIVLFKKAFHFIKREFLFYIWKFVERS